ncbi:hypothetical protein Tco_0282324 [Tanacetum coccineum]
MFMTIQSNVKDKILATSSETSKVENAPAEMLCDLDQQMEKRADNGKENVVTDALSRKERVKPRRVRAMAITIFSIETTVGKKMRQEFVLYGSNLGSFGRKCNEKDIAIYVSKFWTCLKGEDCNVKDFWLAATA